MKKAVLLFLMAAMIAGCIYLKNANMDTVLFKQSTEEGAMFTEECPAESTEEASRDEDVAVNEQQAENDVFIEATRKSMTEKVNTFAYDRLPGEEQIVYKEILQSLLFFEEETEVSTLEPKIIDKVFNCVMMDHPEIFYINGYKYTEYSRDDVVEKIVVTGKYLYDEEEKNRRQELIEKEAEQILANVPDTEDEYQKVKYIYDTLVQQTEYDIQSEDNQNICSVFLQKKSVCQGYAKAMQYLLQKLNMESVLVLGTVTTGEGHAWNLVSVNGEWYYLDATWGDAFYLYGDSTDAIPNLKEEMINYDYLLVTTEQLKQTHSVEETVPLPYCTSMTDNYYVRESLYFDSFDEERMHRIFDKAAENGENSVTMKFSSKEVYDEICYTLLEEQRIFDFLPTPEAVAYINNDEQCSLTFWL